MKTWTRWMRAGAALLALALAACGGGTGDSNGVAATAAPTLQILSNAPGTATGVVTLRFRFSDDVATFRSGVLPYALTGATTVGSTFTKVSASEYTVNIKPNDNAKGVFELTVPAGAFFDASDTNANAVAYSFAQAYDTIKPTGEPIPTFTTSSTGIATGTFTLTITWSEDVGTSFTIDDLLVGDATATEFTRSSGTVYTVKLTPPSSSKGIVLVTIPADAVTSNNSSLSNSRDHALAVFYATN